MKNTLVAIAILPLLLACGDTSSMAGEDGSGADATGSGGESGTGGSDGATSSSTTSAASSSTTGGGGNATGGGAGGAESYGCTEVIGFSQTINWYRGDNNMFEATVAEPDKWQLRAQGGADLKLWVSPDSSLWTNVPVSSACAVGGENFGADRVIFTISSSLGDSVSGDPNGEDWVSYITQVVDTLRLKFANAKQFVLQPVVGGTDNNGDVCTSGNNDVRASFQHPFILQAIEMVVAADTVPDADLGSLRVGHAPTTPDCSYFVDAKGHLGSEQGAGEVGASIAQAYATP